MSSPKLDIIIERVNNGHCPICDLPINLEKKRIIAYENYKGSKQPIHKRHIFYKQA